MISSELFILDQLLDIHFEMLEAIANKCEVDSEFIRFQRERHQSWSKTWREINNKSNGY